MFGGRMLIRRHMEGFFHIGTSQRKQQKNPACFRPSSFHHPHSKITRYFFTSKTAETPGPAYPARGLFLHEDDIESGRRAWTRHSMHRAFARLNVQRLMKIKRLQRSEHFRDDVRHFGTLSQKMNERKAVRQCRKETDERGFRFFHGAVGRVSFYRQ